MKEIIGTTYVSEYVLLLTRIIGKYKYGRRVDENNYLNFNIFAAELNNDPLLNLVRRDMPHDLLRDGI